MISFYHLKLINYDDLSSETWFVIISAHLSLFLGSITYFTAFDAFKSNTSDNSSMNLPVIFNNGGKILFWLSLIFGLIGLFSAIHTWFVLLKIYNSVFEILGHLGKVYQMRVDGEIKGVIPYLSIFIYASILFSALYSAIKKKVKIISFLPLIALIIKNTALAGRANILLGFLEYVFTFIFALYFISTLSKTTPKEKRGLLLQVFFIILLFTLTIVGIKNLRGSVENFAGETRAMQKLQDSPFISPSIYLYLSGHIGVLNKYLEKSNEQVRIGENTFQFVYNFLSLFDLAERPNGYQKGYQIPVWINTGTFLRELIADFGFPATLLLIFSLGFFISFFWNQFYLKFNLFHLINLIFFTLIISISFLMIVTRLADWILSLGFIQIVILSAEKVLKNRVNRY
jgi:oligosaccharide repeat unit polymerase